MPRTVAEILRHADELAGRFEDHEPGTARNATALAELRTAVQDRARAERSIAEAVTAARSEGHSWSVIGMMLGTTGEAARQRYGPTAKAS